MSASIPHRVGRFLPVAAIVALAGYLRLHAIGHASGTPFYDAAVRSMSLSWHNFLFGAVEPAGSVSVDKTPVDLWLQVASTEILGFNTTALHLPEALGGVLAVGLLYGVVRSVWGPGAAALAGLAMAVLPVSVLTARSDTMDSLMAAVLVGALWAAVRAVQTDRLRWVGVSAALVGLAFNIKLTQAVIVIPAVVVMWMAMTPSWPRRAKVCLTGGAVLVITAMAWITPASLTPAGKRPFPIGSRNGSIYRVVFIYNGLDRVRGTSRNVRPTGPGGPGPTRLLRLKGQPYAQRVGLELWAALVMALCLGAAARVRRRDGVTSSELPEPAARWTAAGIGIWLGVGVALFSAISSLQTRYLEAVSPAIAGALGVGAALLLSRARRRPEAAVALAGALILNAAYVAWVGRGLGSAIAVCILATALSVLYLAVVRRPAVGVLWALVVVALLATPLKVSINLLDHNASDAAATGSGGQYVRYLHSHTAGVRYEVASANVYDVMTIVAREGRPVLILNDLSGALIHLKRLQTLVRAGQVRYVVIRFPCGHQPGCPPTTSWSLDHSKPVGRGLYRYF